MGFTRIKTPSGVTIVDFSIPPNTPLSTDAEEYIYYPQDISIVLNQGAIAVHSLKARVTSVSTNKSKVCMVLVGMKEYSSAERDTPVEFDFSEGNLLTQDHNLVAIPCPPFNEIPPGQPL